MKRRTGYTDVIQQAFKGLDKNAVDMLSQFSVKKTYPPNHALCQEGQQEEVFYVVTKGRVVITREVEGSDKDFVIGFKGEGGYFGESALITGEPRGATVTTIVETDVLEISKTEFNDVFASSPSMARSILTTLIDSLRETDRRAIEDLEARNDELADAYEELEEAQADRLAKAAFESQLEVAAQAQRSLLPDTLPKVEGFEFAAKFEPAKHIGGDFYDVRVMDDGRVTILLADVSDKGAHAALFMAVSRTLFLAEEHYHTDPITVVQIVHERLLAATTYDMFVTALYGVLDPKTGVFKYVRAGHDEPILVRNDGEGKFLGGRGRFLGLWEDPPPQLEELEITLEKGDCLVIYSDGVTDMRNPEGDSFGRDKTMELVRNVRMYDAEQISKSIYDTVQRHRKYAEAFDDFTLLVIKAT